MAYYVPVILTADGGQHDVPPIGAYIDPRYLPISPTFGNMLINATDGYYIGADEILSAQDGNMLVKGVDGKLYATPSSIDVTALLSGVPGNQIQVIDGKLYVPVPVPNLQALISSMPDNQLKLIDNKFYVPSIEVVELISADAKNYLRIGSDDKAYIGAGDILSNQAGNMLDVSVVDGKIYYKGVSVSDLVSGDVGQLLGYDSTGKILLTDAMLASVKGIQEAPSDGSGYVRMNGAWARIAGNLTINPNDKILSQDMFGLLATTQLVFNNSTGQLELVGKSGALISAVTLPASQVIKSASVVTDPAGQPAGTYLVMVFDTPTGDETVYINVSSLITNYTAGNSAVAISNDHKISVVVDAASPLKVGSFGLTYDNTTALSVDVGNGISIGSDGKLYVAANVSSDVGNVLADGSDHGAYFSSDYGTM